jgi:hypothetical protein
LRLPNPNGLRPQRWRQPKPTCFLYNILTVFILSCLVKILTILIIEKCYIYKILTLRVIEN